MPKILKAGAAGGKGKKKVFHSPEKLILK